MFTSHPFRSLIPIVNRENCFFVDIGTKSCISYCMCYWGTFYWWCIADDSIWWCRCYGCWRHWSQHWCFVNSRILQVIIVLPFEWYLVSFSTAFSTVFFTVFFFCIWCLTRILDLGLWLQSITQFHKKLHGPLIVAEMVLCMYKYPVKLFLLFIYFMHVFLPLYFWTGLLCLPCLSSWAKVLLFFRIGEGAGVLVLEVG